MSRRRRERARGRDGTAPLLRLSDDEHERWRRETGFRELRALLHWHWDPVGIADDFPVCEDEYDDYVNPVIKRLRDGGGAEAAGEYLRSIEREWMGGSGACSEAIAPTVAHWYETSLDRWRRGGVLEPDVGALGDEPSPP